MRLLVLVVVAGVASMVFAQPAPDGGRAPMDPTRAVEQAIELIKTGDLAQAGQLIRDATVARPDMNKLKLANGLLAMELKRYTEAIEYLGAYNTSPEGGRDYRGHAAVGSAYLKSHMFSSALYPLGKAWENAPLGEQYAAIRASIALDRARAHLGLVQADDAKTAIADARASAPKNGAVQADVCELAARAQDFSTARAAAATAIEIFNSELRDNPLSEAAHGNLMRCYQILFSIQRKELTDQPNNGAAFVEAARLERSISNVERRLRILDARSLVMQALQSDEKNTEWQLLAAECEIELGAMADAAARLDAILKVLPNHAEAVKLRGRIVSPSAS